MPHGGSRPSLTREQQAELLRRREQGQSWNQIASAMAIPRSTAARYGQFDRDGRRDNDRDNDRTRTLDRRDAWDLDEQPYGPDQHQLARQALGLRTVKDTYVLSIGRDPFYSGTPAHTRDGQWFGQLWRDLGMPDGSHPRRVHYKADAVGTLKPDGTPYRNNKNDWAYLQAASAKARIMGLVDVEAVADRRSGGVSASVSATRNPDGTPGAELRDSDGIGWDGWQVPAAELPGLDPVVMPQAGVTGYEYETADQPVLVEVWCEKSTMDDILVPLCDRLGAPLASEIRGYESITHIVELLRRAETYPSRRAVVLYISDNDGAGGNMPVAVARQCQFWATQLDVEAEVLIQPIVLTKEQVAEFGLPKTEDGKTELDALEALRPGELARIVEAEVEAWRDPELAAELARTGAQAQERVSREWDEASRELTGELAVIRADAEAIIDVYRPVIEQLNQRLADGPGQRLAGLAERTVQAADDAGWELPDRPEPEDPEVPEDILYDSNRHWLDQLQAYRAHKGQPPLELP